MTEPTVRATPATDSHRGQIALVTGANKGIGRQIAGRLADLGMTVYLGARDTERGTKAAAELSAEAPARDVRFVRLDVTDPQTAAAAAELIGRAHGRLDALVNNAGINPEGGTPPTEVGLDLLRRGFETNVFGAVTVTNAMLPLLRAAQAARVVNMSSELGSLTLAADPGHLVAGRRLLVYNSAKAALNSITLIYANELRGDGIMVNAANPGYCATDLNGHRGVLSAEQGAAVPAELAALPPGGPTGRFVGDRSPEGTSVASSSFGERIGSGAEVPW
ncbi:SDR family oxidoreductase [Allonocardiopsis opalescens]|uniref:NAD(P)-dependent dehydrogenase (Short-subunit alcohol dehydrogenase family) n=1 Tax=Allonocardiopsis opalescens TaxID=1144618 RepID=A0A2T0PWN4_9ACTN|nr:SDR family oxidoreductase [Allonocardiopsis opalescens]PRX95778.1 NAD(P)-dependent dehydrogenase (short-subunit alcohol dehydrogenase family) [Allonocardiopsis opalescens]